MKLGALLWAAVWALMTPEEGGGLVKFTKQFKVATVDAKDLELRVKERGFEVFWHASKTRFYHHRSVPLKEIGRDATLHVFGKLHERRRDPQGYGESSPIISDVEYIGTGSAFKAIALTSSLGGVAWHQARVSSTSPNVFLEVSGSNYRLVGADKVLVHVVEPAAPEKLAGKAIFLRGNSRKVTVERDGKPQEVTRVFATEIHLVELAPEHARVFQTEWWEKKAAPKKEGAKKAGKAK